MLTFAPHPLDEVGQRLPLCGVHVCVFLVRDVLLIHDVRLYPLRTKPPPQQLQERVKELSEVIGEIILIWETQRRQYEGHNTPLGHCTDQGL